MNNQVYYLHMNSRVNFHINTLHCFNKNIAHNSMTSNNMAIKRPNSTLEKFEFCFPRRVVAEKMLFSFFDIFNFGFILLNNRSLTRFWSFSWWIIWAVFDTFGPFFSHLGCLIGKGVTIVYWMRAVLMEYDCNNWMHYPGSQTVITHLGPFSCTYKWNEFAY